MNKQFTIKGLPNDLLTNAIVNERRLKVDNGTSSTAFGSASVESFSPITQIKSTTGLLSGVLTVTDGDFSGTNTVVDKKYTCTSGTNSDGLASILTQRQLTTRSGQGSVALFSSVFGSPAVDVNQAAGLITAETFFTFGYIGLNFGILSGRDGEDELQELTLTSDAGSENVNITIDGIVYAVPLSGGGTVQIDAYEIAVSLSSQVPNYRFTSNNDQVVAQAVISEPQGSFAYSSGGSSIGSWSQITAGAIPSVDFIPQASWNKDTRLSGSTAEMLNPLFMNYYKIQLNGSADFFVEDSETKESVLVHRISFANVDNKNNPAEETLRVGWLVRNVGSTTGGTIQGAYAGAFIEGNIFYDTAAQGLSAEQNVTAGSGNRSVIILRNRISFNNKVNRAEILPIIISATSQTSKFVHFKVLINPAFSSPVTFQYRDKDNSVVEIAEDDVEVTGGLIIGSDTVEVGAGSKNVFNTNRNRTTAIYPGSTICVIAEIPSGGGSSDCQVDVTFQEDL